MSEQEFNFDIPMEAASADMSGGPLTILAKIKAKAIGIVEDTLERYKSGNLKLPSKEEFLVKASHLYDTLCAVIDLPTLGEKAEQAFELVMKPAFMRAAEFAYDRFTTA